MKHLQTAALLLVFALGLSACDSLSPDHQGASEFKVQSFDLDSPIAEAKLNRLENSTQAGEMLQVAVDKALEDSSNLSSKNSSSFKVQQGSALTRSFATPKATIQQVGPTKFLIRQQVHLIDQTRYSSAVVQADGWIAEYTEDQEVVTGVVLKPFWRDSASKLVRVNLTLAGGVKVENAYQILDYINVYGSRTGMQVAFDTQTFNLLDGEIYYAYAVGSYRTGNQLFKAQFDLSSCTSTSQFYNCDLDFSQETAELTEVSINHRDVAARLEPGETSDIELVSYLYLDTDEDNEVARETIYNLSGEYDGNASKTISLPIEREFENGEKLEVQLHRLQGPTRGSEFDYIDIELKDLDCDVVMDSRVAYAPYGNVLTRCRVPSKG